MNFGTTITTAGVPQSDVKPIKGGASKPKYIIPRECLDAKGNLKPDSLCAKKMREAKETHEPKS